MLQYLIIQLDDTSTSYCHYSNDKKESRLISLEDLKKGILAAIIFPVMLLAGVGLFLWKRKKNME